MCLYVGLKNKFVAKHDIIVYKRLLPTELPSIWTTPFMEWPIEFNKVLIPKGNAKEKKVGTFKYKIAQGIIHAYTSSPKLKEECENVFIAKIPKGTTFWLQDDLKEVAAKRIIITEEHPEPNKITDLSEYYHLGVDVYLKSGNIVKNNDKFDISEVMGLVVSKNEVISMEFESYSFYKGSILSCKSCSILKDTITDAIKCTI